MEIDILTATFAMVAVKHGTFWYVSICFVTHFSDFSNADIKSEGLPHTIIFHDIQPQL